MAPRLQTVDPEVEIAKLKRNINTPILKIRDLAAGSFDPSYSLEKRDCKDNNCRCALGTAQGQYCGRSNHVIDLGDNWDWADIYECNPWGGCCNYGVATVCKEPRR